MDLDAVVAAVRPVLGVFGLLVFTHAMGKLACTPARADSSRDARRRKAAMYAFWVFFFVYLLEPSPVWVQLALLLAALLSLGGVFSAPLRRRLFRHRPSDGDAA